MHKLYSGSIYLSNHYSYYMKLIKTQKLYWDDPYAIEFNAKITFILKGGIILDKTLFFPFSGNQASDKGVIRKGKFESNATEEAV